MARSTTPGKKRSAARTMSVGDRQGSPAPKSATPSRASSRERSVDSANIDDGAQRNEEKGNNNDSKTLKALPPHMAVLSGGPRSERKRRFNIGTDSTTSTAGTQGSQTQDDQHVDGMSTPETQRTGNKRARKDKRKRSEQGQTDDDNDNNDNDNDDNVQGDFSDLFVIDTTPSAVPRHLNLGDDKKPVEREASDEHKASNGDADIAEFTKQAYVVSSSDAEDDDDDGDSDDHDVEVQGLARTDSKTDSDAAQTGPVDDVDDDSFEMPEELKGVIVDDSGAKNCPTLWRVYDTTDAKPAKRKIVFACANDGSTKDHFIDDCYLPRGHPIRQVDPSAFNRVALGDAARGLPEPMSLSQQGGPSSQARRRFQARVEAQRYHNEEDDEAADDDWFASRSRSNVVDDRFNRDSSGSQKKKRGNERSGNDNANKPAYRAGKFAKHNVAKRGGQGDAPKLSFRFNDESRGGRGAGDHSRGSSRGQSPRDWERPSHERRGGGREPWQDTYRGGNNSYDSRRGGSGRADREERDGGGGGGRGGGRRHGGSLASRFTDRPAPRYQGGYV
ncbi:hypothetical protein OIO90_001313 [Microbotryomycetes sp. JL221]|nr:hypothetical protein OIO90_001313 [Microbotryomycetes sp. JL221]